MPDYPAVADPVSHSSYTLTLKDQSGAKARVTLSGGGLENASGAQRAAWRTAVAALSNAGLQAENYTAGQQIAENLVVAFDEGYSSVESKAVMFFQNAQLEVIRFEIPAPDASIFGPDGQTVDYTNLDVLAFIVATRNALNAGDPAGTFEWMRGMKSGRTRKRRAGTTKPTIAEPSALQNPPPDPGD